jgi:hypothetical protein
MTLLPSNVIQIELVEVLHSVPQNSILAFSIGDSDEEEPTQQRNE